MPAATLLRKYFEGLVIDSPTSALAAKCMIASGLASATALEDLLAVGQVALDERGARIERQAMALGQVVEDGDLMAGVDQLLGANAADVARAARDENMHARLKAGHPR